MKYNKSIKDKYLKLLADIRRATLFAVDEIPRLCGELSVCASTADAAYGEYWCVYAHPVKKHNNDSLMDILLHIRPISQEADYVAEGLQVLLASEDNRSYWIGDGPTNECGQTWFRNVPDGCYHIVLDEAQVSLLAATQLPLKAAAAGPPKNDLIVFHPEDRRLRVDLERSKDGNVVLTVSTQASELAEASVDFTVGHEHGIVILNATEIDDDWEGVCELQLPFCEAVKSVPMLTVLPKRANRQN